MRKGIKQSIMLVTPELAAQWLLLNLNNRPVSANRVKQYVNDMLNGRWLLDGTPIRFARTDAGPVLLDGQHRLQAVVESGVSVHFLIVEGIDPEAQIVMDTGMVRTPGNTLSIEGVPNGQRVAGIARLVYAYDNEAVGKHPFISVNFTRPVLIGFVKTHEQQFIDAQRYAEKLRKARRYNAIASGAFYFLAARNNQYLLELKDFGERCSTMIGLQEGDPVIALDNFVMRYRGVRIANKSEIELAAQIRAWNAFVKGEQLKQVRQPFAPGAGFPRMVTDDVDRVGIE